MKVTFAAITDESKLDPRIVRTRKLLLTSFKELLDEEGAVRNVSVQSIADRAGVNRVTFYAHFTDKYELLDFWKRSLFRARLNEKLDNNTSPTFDQLIEAVLDFMVNYQHRRKRINQQFEPLFESAIQGEIQATLLRIPNVDTDTAVFLAWAIFGSANEWSRNKERLSKDAMAKKLLQIVGKVLQ